MELNGDNKVERKDEHKSVQTIEQTGKPYKGAMLIGLLLAAIAIPAVWAGKPVAAFCLGVIGMTTFFAGNLLAWWYHG